MNAPTHTSPPLATLLFAVLAVGALACAWQAVQAHGIATAERQAKEREVALRENAELQARTAQEQNLETQLVLAFFQSEVLTAKSSDRRIPDHKPSDLRPRDATYWEKREDHAVDIGHVFKYPYSYYDLLRRANDPELTQAFEAKAYQLF